MDNELERKMNDLAASALKKQRYVAGKFLTPAEQAQVRKMRFYAGVSLSFAGGAESCERCIPVFFPDYLENEEPDYTEFLRAVKISSSGSGFTHRDVLGAVLATGIERECVGDITVMENDAYVYLLPAAQANVLSVLISVGRNHVTVSGIDLANVNIASVAKGVLYRNHELSEALSTILMACVHISNQKFYGVFVLNEVLHGSTADKIIKAKLDKVPEYGMLKWLPINETTFIINWLIDNHYLHQTKGQYPVLHPTSDTGLFSEKITTAQLNKLKTSLERMNL